MVWNRIMAVMIFEIVVSLLMHGNPNSSLPQAHADARARACTHPRTCTTHVHADQSRAKSAKIALLGFQFSFARSQIRHS